METKSPMSSRIHVNGTQSSDRDRLLPLMFEMGRSLKCEMMREGSSFPSFLHLETLRFIQEKEMPTMSEIADYLRIAPPTATALMNTFVKEGFIERSEDSHDRRRVRLILSKKGVALLKEAMQRRNQAVARLTSSLSNKDCAELARILSVITQAL